MNQSAVWTDERNTTYRQWTYEELWDLKQSLLEERRQLEEEKRIFESEKKEFSIKKQMEDRRLEQENQLFGMKWKLLESELKKLAAEKEQVARQRDFYRFVCEHEGYGSEASPKVVRGELFFCGVNSEDALKKRYTDLIKIYHPDNLYGDKSTLQEINSEYEKLKVIFG